MSNIVNFKALMSEEICKVFVNFLKISQKLN